MFSHEVSNEPEEEAKNLFIHPISPPIGDVHNFRVGTTGALPIKTHQDFFKAPPITYYDNASSQEFESLSFN